MQVKIDITADTPSDFMLLATLLAGIGAHSLPPSKANTLSQAAAEDTPTPPEAPAKNKGGRPPKVAEPEAKPVADEKPATPEPAKAVVEATKEPAAAATLQDVTQAMMRVLKAKKTAGSLQQHLVKTFGVTSHSALKPEQYGEAVASLDAFAAE